MPGSIRYYGKGKVRRAGARIERKPYTGPSRSRVPVKCNHCREFLTVRGRHEKRCTECKHDYIEQGAING